MLKARSIAAALLWMMSATAFADPGYYVVTAYSNEGMRTVDFRYWTVRMPGSYATRWPELGFGYGVTSRWHTELYASYIGATDSATHLNTVNWQNDVLLTQGEYPFDLALHATLIDNTGAGQGIEYGPVFQTDIGRTQLNANLFFEREFHTGRTERTQLQYQWQIRHRWTPLFQFGLQGFGEVGPWDHWSPHERQSHRAGPAFFGSLALGAARALNYQAAYLMGSVYGSNADMFTMRVWYDF